MSVRQMVMVWEHEFSAPQQAVMLALADHAHDDGTSIRPGLERVAWKTGYSLRQTKRIVKGLRDAGVLVLTQSHGDGRPTEYRINWTSARPKTPFGESKGDTDGKSDILSEGAKVTSEASKSDIPGTPKVTSEASKSDIAVSPEPSLTVTEPSREPSLEHAPEKNAFETVAKIIGDRNAAWLRDSRGFDFARAVGTFPDLGEVWQKALTYPPRKPRDKPLFRFQDACEGILDLSPPTDGAGLSGHSGRGVKVLTRDPIAEKRRRDAEAWAAMGVDVSNLPGSS